MLRPLIRLAICRAGFDSVFQAGYPLSLRMTLDLRQWAA
ncbi:unannotated protein [freshwater metagenome]|uniref:Unannotated protein n=1 Tax=freshwater metagenome TaxID=449393 RepID=A0A6J6MI55_9ZZZZ